MLKKLKSKLGFIFRGLVGIKDNLIDNPKISKNIKSFSIGKTLLGEDIKCYKFGEGEEKILYFGGIHGNEVGTVKLMNFWVKYLSDHKYFGNKQVFVIPCLNIDGYKKSLKNPDYFNGGIIGKTNSNNVDLNRNFPTKNWSSKTKLFASGKYYDISGGYYPSSEPEIKSFINFVEKENIKNIYAYHNCWGTVMGTFTDTCDKKVNDYSNISRYSIYKKNDWNNLKDEQKTGHGTVWGIENNIDFIEVELKTRWGSEWNKNTKALKNTLK